MPYNYCFYQNIPNGEKKNAPKPRHPTHLRPTRPKARTPTTNQPADQQPYQRTTHPNGRWTVPTSWPNQTLQQYPSDSTMDPDHL